MVCRRTKKIVFILFYFSIKILVPLHPPSNIRIQSINGTTVEISWNSLLPTDQNGFITNYKVNINNFQQQRKINFSLLRLCIFHFYLLN